MKRFIPYKIALAFVIMILLMSHFASFVNAVVPIRVSIKFIVDGDDNRPTNGNLNTDAEIQAEINWGNTILGDNLTEYSIQVTELVDITGVDQWYTTTCGGVSGAANRSALRTAAVAAPNTYLWRTNAINIYINNGPSSAISAFPPDNDIIFMNQWCSNTPSCILHELGHSLDLLHTHESCCTNQDKCADTITDDKDWTRDQIARNNYGDVYANLTAAQRDNVDLVFNNVMSYHAAEPQLRLSACQMDIASTTGDSDRSWLLARNPVYVDGSNNGAQNGRYANPYKTIQAAINSGLTNDVLIVEQGTYDEPTSAMSAPGNTVMTRSGPSTIGNGALDYTLPTDLEKSDTPQVSNVARAIQAEDKASRSVMKNAKIASETADAQKISLIVAQAKAQQRQHKDNAISYLIEAEKFASGQEKVAILLELAQRHKFDGKCKEASRYYRMVADATQQPALSDRAIYQAENCESMLPKVPKSKNGEIK